MAAMQLITFDEDGNCIGSNFMDYLIPTAWETPQVRDLATTVTPSPHHPIGAKGVGESATVGSPAAYVNAVIDALAHLGVRNIDMPVTLGEGVGGDAGGRAGGARDRRRPRAGATSARERGRAVRARHRGVAAGAVLRPAGVEGAHRRGRHGHRVARRRLRRAGGGARGDARARGRRAAADVPRAGRELEGARREGVVTVPMACESEGAMEVYLEPVLPQPQLVAIGRSPGRGRARRHGGRARLADALVDEEAELAAGGSRDRPGARTSSSRPRATTTRRPSRSRWPRRRPTSAWSPRASGRRRCSTTCADGASDEALARIRAPAGLDLGATEPAEIAVAILAEIVQLRAAGELPRACGRAAPPEEAIDPVCGMAVAVETSRYRAERDGRTYHFCSAGCRARFVSAEATAGSSLGWSSRTRSRCPPPRIRSGSSCSTSSG